MLIAEKPNAEKSRDAWNIFRQKARQEALCGIANTKASELYCATGAQYTHRIKDIPNPLYLTPLHMSGNDTFLLPNDPLKKMRGGAWTQDTTRMVQENLKKRALEYKKISEKRGKPDFNDDVPNGVHEEKMFMLQELINEFYVEAQNIEVDDLIDYKTEDVRKILVLLYEVGFYLQLTKLEDYHNKIDQAYKDLKKHVARGKIAGVSKTFLLCDEILKLIRAYITCYNMPFKERKLFMKNIIKNMSTLNESKNFEKYVDNIKQTMKSGNIPKTTEEINNVFDNNLGKFNVEDEGHDEDQTPKPEAPRQEEEEEDENERQQPLSDESFKTPRNLISAVNTYTDEDVQNIYNNEMSDEQRKEYDMIDVVNNQITKFINDHKEGKMTRDELADEAAKISYAISSIYQNKTKIRDKNIRTAFELKYSSLDNNIRIFNDIVKKDVRFEMLVNEMKNKTPYDLRKYTPANYINLFNTPLTGIKISNSNQNDTTNNRVLDFGNEIIDLNNAHNGLITTLEKMIKTQPKPQLIQPQQQEAQQEQQQEPQQPQLIQPQQQEVQQEPQQEVQQPEKPISEYSNKFIDEIFDGYLNNSRKKQKEQEEAQKQNAIKEFSDNFIGDIFDKQLEKQKQQPSRVFIDDDGNDLSQKKLTDEALPIFKDVLKDIDNTIVNKISSDETEESPNLKHGPNQEEEEEEEETPKILQIEEQNVKTPEKKKDDDEYVDRGLKSYTNSKEAMRGKTKYSISNGINIIDENNNKTKIYSPENISKIIDTYKRKNNYNVNTSNVKILDDLATSIVNKKPETYGESYDVNTYKNALIEALDTMKKDNEAKTPERKQKPPRQSITDLRRPK